MPELLFVLLNPSSAGGPDVPATLRRCDRIALSLGHASYRVAHLFAYPARQPRLLVAAALAGVDIVGPRNDEHLAAAVRGARRVVVAWGSFRGAAVRALVVPRAEVVAERLSALAMCPLECLAVAPDGAPCHPLFVRGDATPAVWRALRSAARRDGLAPPVREPASRVLPFAPVAADVPPTARVASGPPALGRLAACRARAAAARAVASTPRCCSRCAAFSRSPPGLLRAACPPSSPRPCGGARRHPPASVSVGVVPSLGRRSRLRSPILCTLVGRAAVESRRPPRRARRRSCSVPSSRIAAGSGLPNRVARFGSGAALRRYPCAAVLWRLPATEEASCAALHSLSAPRRCGRLRRR